MATVRAIDAQLAAYEADMRRDFKYHLSHVDNVLYAMAERGDNFFDETIRLQRIFDLMNADKVRGMFEREVVADTAAQVDAHTRELIDWLVDQDFHQWQAVTDYLNKRITLHEGRIVGKVDGKFEYNRQALLESVGHAAREVVASYDTEPRRGNWPSRCRWRSPRPPLSKSAPWVWGRWSWSWSPRPWPM